MRAQKYSALPPVSDCETSQSPFFEIGLELATLAYSSSCLSCESYSHFYQLWLSYSNCIMDVSSSKDVHYSKFVPNQGTFQRKFLSRWDWYRYYFRGFYGRITHHWKAHSSGKISIKSILYCVSNFPLFILFEQIQNIFFSFEHFSEQQCCGSMSLSEKIFSFLGACHGHKSLC